MQNCISDNVLARHNSLCSDLYWKGLFIIFCFVFIPSGYAQVKGKKQEEAKTVSAKSRWAFRTNAVDWLLTVPNIGVEYDLTNSVYNKLTLNLEGKWNWHTSHNYSSGTVFDLWDVRPEIRKYWRTEYRANTGNKPNLKEKLFSRERSNPKYWRAYYLGLYTSANGYSFKFGKRGFQGNSYGIGISAGYSIPLYSYKTHFIDVEFGGSLGLSYAKYDVYELDRENNCYIPVSEKSKDFHFVPFPVVSDVRVSFVYRFASVKDKYKMINHEKIQAKERHKIERKQHKDSVRTARHLTDSLKQMRKRIVKDSIRQVKQVTDSLKRVEKNIPEKKKRKSKLPDDETQKNKAVLKDETL